MRNTRKRTGSLHSPKTAVKEVVLIACENCGMKFSIIKNRTVSVTCPYCEQSSIILPKGSKYEIDWRNVC